MILSLEMIFVASELQIFSQPNQPAYFTNKHYGRLTSELGLGAANDGGAQRRPARAARGPRRRGQCCHSLASWANVTAARPRTHRSTRTGRPRAEPSSCGARIFFKVQLTRHVDFAHHSLKE